jgi:flagellar biosynthesis GTPase FlhF
MWRWLVVIVVLIGVVLAGIALNRVIATFGIAALDGNQATLVASGWATVWHAWPIALAGVLVGLLIGMAGAPLLLDAARAADYAQHRRQMALQVQQAEAQAAQAQQNAERSLERERQEARRLAQQSRMLMEATEAERSELEQWRKSISLQVNQQLDQASQEVNEAHRVIADTEQRRINATAAAERRRRKLAKHGLA